MASPSQLTHQVEDLAATDRVERADRLVEEQDGRRTDQSLGDAQTLAHAARVGGRSGDRRRRPGRHVRGSPSTRPASARRLRIQRGHEAQRVATGHPVVEARILGEVADLAAVARAGADRDARDGGRAAGRGGQAGEELDGRRLAGAVGAEEAVDGAGRHVQAEVGQRRHAGVVLGQAGRGDGRGLGHVVVSDVVADRMSASMSRASAREAAASSVRGPEIASPPMGAPGGHRLIPWYRSRLSPGRRWSRGGPGRPRRRGRPPAPDPAGRACRGRARRGS